MHRTILLLILQFSIFGCARRDGPATLPASTSQQPLVLVVGDGSSADVAVELRKRGLNVTNDRALISSASMIVIAQEAPVGPMPVHRDVLKEIARTDNRNLLWIQTKTSAIDDGELLELVELESRELLNVLDLPGDTVQFAVDSESAPVEAASPTLKGWTAIHRFVSSQGTE